MPSHTLCALTRLSPCIARFVFGRRRLDVCTVLDGGQHTTLEHTFRARQLDACAEDVMPPGTQDPLATLTTPYKSKPVGFEPTRGDPIGPAGQRLSRSAKVSSARRSKSAAFESRQSCDCQSLLLLPPSPRHLARSHRLMRTVCISRESNPGQMATMYSTTRPLMPLENLWT